MRFGAIMDLFNALGVGIFVKTEKRRGRHITKLPRLPLLLLTLLLQMAAIILPFMFFRRTFAFFNTICECVSLVVVLYILRSDANPSYKIPWIIFNILLPIMGGLMFVAFGRVRFSRDERRRYAQISKTFDEAVSRQNRLAELEKYEPALARQSRYIFNATKSPVYRDTDVTYFPIGEKMFEQMLIELEGAREFIFMEYFIIHPGIMWRAICEILERKASEGVDVRVIYDDIGSMTSVPDDFIASLKRRGIQALVFNKFTNIFSARFNNRDHRKICVIDGNTAFTGGINIADEYINKKQRFGHWKDTAIMLKGAAVWSFTCMFLSFWDYEARVNEDFSRFSPTETARGAGFVQPFADTPYDAELTGETVYRNLLAGAHDYVYIATPYLIIDNEMLTALSIAAKSGADVRIVTPGIPDKKIAYTLTRSFYGVLMRAGVRIYEYAPGFMHAKQFVSDDRCAVVGTINLDYRSLCHHHECAVWLLDARCVGDIKEDMLKTFALSREVTFDDLKKGFLGRGLIIAILRLLAPLF